MRASIEEYKAVEKAAMKFVKSVAEGNSSYAKELFVDEAVLFGYLDGRLEHGSIKQFYHNVDTVGAGDDFKARIDIVSVDMAFQLESHPQYCQSCIMPSRGTFSLRYLSTTSHNSSGLL